jgi:hypothetical protein
MPIDYNRLPRKLVRSGARNTTKAEPVAVRTNSDGCYRRRKIRAGKTRRYGISSTTKSRKIARVSPETISPAYPWE